MAEDKMAAAHGGSRSQRRNHQKRHLSKPQDTGEPDAPDAPDAPPQTEEQPPKKKTKKEKQREKKAAAAAEAATQTGSGSNAAPRKRVRDEDPDEIVKRQAIESGRRVFVGRLPQSATEDGIRSFFAQCGALAKVDLQRRHELGKPGRFKGAAFLTFADQGAAEKALGFNGSEWGEGGVSTKQIVVARALAVGGEVTTSSGSSEAAKAGELDEPQCGATASSARPSGTKSSQAKSSQVKGKPDGKPDGKPVEAQGGSSCFVGGLPEGATEHQVRAAFRPVCGSATIRKVKLLPPADGERRGFVDFTTAVAAAAAVAGNGTIRLGQDLLTVAFSRRSTAPSGDGRRSQEAKARRRQKRKEQQQESSAP